MNNQEIIEKLKNFAGRDRRSLSEIAIRDGVAYVSDGRIGFAAKLPEPQEDNIPQNYPIDTLKDIIDGAKVVTGWSEIDQDEFKPLDADFRERLKNATQEVLVDHSNRYIETVCPCCGETVYWDQDDEEIVSEKEEKPVTEWRDVTRILQVKFDDGRGININLCYLHKIISAFGDIFLFTIGKDKNSNYTMLHMVSRDGTINGVLMSMRYFYGYFVADCMVHANSVERKPQGVTV